MCLATFDRRVQILLDPARYAALEHGASVHRQSVASLIREAVDERLRRSRQTKMEALERLLSSADVTGPPIMWEEVKDSFERDYLRDLPGRTIRYCSTLPSRSTRSASIANGASHAKQSSPR